MSMHNDSRSGFLTRWSTVGLLIVGLATSLPLFAQQVSEYESPQIFVPRDQIETLVEYQKMLEGNPRSSLANYRIVELLFKQRPIRPARTIIGMHYTVTGFPGGLKSGAISNWVRSSILPSSATGRRTNTSWHCRRKTTLWAPSVMRSNCCRSPMSGRELSKSLSTAAQCGVGSAPIRRMAGWP
jgi:hypothetical protein